MNFRQVHENEVRNINKDGRQVSQIQKDFKYKERVTKESYTSYELKNRNIEE